MLDPLSLILGFLIGIIFMWLFTEPEQNDQIETFLNSVDLQSPEAQEKFDRFMKDYVFTRKQSD